MKILCVLLTLLLVSCAPDVNINEELHPYIEVAPFEGYYAQVDIYDAEAEVPEYVMLEGKWYAVSVINSSVPPEGYEKQTVLTVRDGIMAINSGAYAKFEQVTTVNLPDSLQGLGKNSLPPNTAELTLPSLPCQDLKLAVSDPSTVKKVTITDMGFADISSLTSLEEVTVVDGVWPYFPTLADKVEEGLFFQGFFQDGVYCQPGKVGKGTATPVWAENPSEQEQPQFIGITSFRLFIYFSTEERFRMTYEEGDTWRFVVPTDGGYTYKWYVDNKEVHSGGDYFTTRTEDGQLEFEYSNVPIGLAHTVRCALFEGDELKAVTQLTFTAQ